MTVDPRAVEAASRAALTPRWDDVHPDDHAYWENTARDMLEAAAPYLKADGWDECAQWHEDYHLKHGEPPLFDTAAHTNPYRRNP